MRRSFLILIASLAFLSTARALNSELPITSTNLNTFFYSFSVSTNTVKNGVAFRVTITNKKFDIYPESSAAVGVVVRTEITNNPRAAITGPLKEATLKPLNPAIRVKLKKDKRVWTADFTASRELLKNPEACLVFSVPGYGSTKDKNAPKPAQDLYELKLQDFAKP